MDQQITVFVKKSAPSKSIVLVTLLVVLALSCLFIKKISHKFKTAYTHQTLSLPEQKLDNAELTSTEEDHDWTTITTRSGDTLGSIFKRLGLRQQTLQALLQNNSHAKTLTRIKPNQKIQMLIRDKNLEKIIFPLSTTQVLLIYRENNHYYSKIKSRDMDSHNQYVTATVRGSLYGTAKQMNIPYKLIQQMTEIFNWEINFAKDVRPGDQFSIVYNAYYIDDSLVSTGEILAVTYTNRGKVYKAIRHVSASGDYDYFTPEGTSLKKAFSRYPIHFSHISSSFSLSRKHPLLHYNRPHKGIDLAAPIGTPIRATGDGRIQMIGRHTGYGNMVKLAHNKTFTSLYGHMLRFQKGLAQGDIVKRGQVIGYVGQTGLATGPHCHYEFHINQHPKNPTTVELPRASPVPARERAAFKANAGVLLARLKLYEEGHFAAMSGKRTA
jgi:murein DD-endopeptidase MepM/ murein hydrolase activator NlpD